VTGAAESADDRKAYRAAGQAYAAAVLDLPIKYASVRGIELNWPANRSMSWNDYRADVAMGLTGAPPQLVECLRRRLAVVDRGEVAGRIKSFCSVSISSLRS
jgi:hypothetical protein